MLMFAVPLLAALSVRSGAVASRATAVPRASRVLMQSWSYEMGLSGVASSKHPTEAPKVSRAARQVKRLLEAKEEARPAVLVQAEREIIAYEVALRAALENVDALENRLQIAESRVVERESELQTLMLRVAKLEVSQVNVKREMAQAVAAKRAARVRERAMLKHLAAWRAQPVGTLLRQALARDCAALGSRFRSAMHRAGLLASATASLGLAVAADLFLLALKPAESLARSISLSFRRVPAEWARDPAQWRRRDELPGVKGADYQ